ncbi:hypothetical protein H072_3958 [Dactylellina haptotyla CBS 200.50]|uniref:Uncharacterized protein n=1 Tax=Dactylellina haptotyla (strain CBS 200.50) TaxID=1284197 RepID=S8BRN9_DACHA|nr:hypothetical protein H072_3958 [Dactylellina haptotyla CBS 200.50]
MADPFSIATGAIGLVGLALTATKSLHDFSTAIKTSSETIRQIKTNSDILSHMLMDIAPVLSDASVGSQEKEVIETCVHNCKGNFERLDKLVAPFLQDVVDTKPCESNDVNENGEVSGEVLDRSINTPVGSTARSLGDAKAKFRLKLKKLGWPFKEKETKELLYLIDRAIQHLGIALDMVHSKTSLKVLSIAEHQHGIVQETQIAAKTIESHTVEITTMVRANSATLRDIQYQSQSTTDAIELRLQKLESSHQAREQETQKLLLQLLSKLETSGNANNIGAPEVTHAVDPLARQIMQKTLNQDFSMQHAPSNAASINNDPPPAYTPRPFKYDPEINSQENYNTTTKDWSWETPFGRISVFTTHHQRDEAKKGALLSKDKSTSRYRMMFTPAPWLYSKAAAFAFIKKVDGFGMQFTTPAVFKAEEPALKYLRRGEFERLRDAVAENGFLLNAVHEYSGRTLLAEAVRCRRYDACKYLLELGADPETEDYRGSTLFNLLFNLNIKPYQVNTCLKVFSLLLQTRADLFRGKATVMHSAVTTRYVNIDSESVQKILQTVYSSVSNLASIDDPDVAGNSPLVSACTFGHDNHVIVDFLLRNGANRSALPEKLVLKSDTGVPMSMSVAYPAFYATARAGYIGSMRRLIEAGLPGDPNIYTDLGRNILHSNVRRSVKFNSPRKSSNSKVSMFQEKHDLWKDNFEFLVARGAQVNAIDAQGWTVLHCAALGPYCDKEMLKVLLDCGANVNIRDIDGHTAWDLAAKYGRTRLGAWKWFGAEMFKRGKLKPDDLKGRVEKRLYLEGKWWEDGEGEGQKDTEAVDMLSTDASLQWIPDDDEWMFMSSMHPYESDQVFGEDKKLDPEAAGVKYRFPVDEFWHTQEIQQMHSKAQRRMAGGQQKSEINGNTWIGTVGNVLAAFVG